MPRILEVYDIETLSNLFTYTGYRPSDKKYYQFVISPLRNDVDALIEHLKGGLYLVGFNNEGFDYPVIHHLIRHYMSGEYQNMSGLDLSMRLYQKAQDVIEMEFSTIADKNKFIPQLDLYRIWHYNNKARATSLKWLEVHMQLHNVEDMPFGHGHWITTWDEVEQVLAYNKNDVYATYKFYQVTKGETDHAIHGGADKLQMRKQIQRDYGIPCLNYNDVKIGEELLLKLYCDVTGLNPWDVKKLRTPRPVIDLKECIFPYIKFKTEPYQELHKWLMSQVLTSTKDAFSNLSIERAGNLAKYMHPDSFKKKKDGTRYIESLNITLNGEQVGYGTGGLHHSSSGVFESNDEWEILDIDVGSMYPSIEIQNGLFPQHLGPVFTKVLDENIVSVRLAEKSKPKKLRDQVIMNGFKLAANGSYGKSNEESSFLYDPKYTMQTTVNGQLLLSMLVETIWLEIKSAKFLQQNTDGITVLLKREEHDKCIAICKAWEKLTKLELEYNYYKKMVIADVSTYLAEYEDGSVKLKNDFEIDKDFHKNPSMRIIPIALKEYFINKTPVEKTIREHKDIFDFCLALKAIGTAEVVWRHIDGFEIKEKKLSKTTRYYASITGGNLYKIFSDKDEITGEVKKRVVGVNVGQNVTIFNKYVEKEISEYNIDYNFYIREARKVIDKIETQPFQQKLF